MALLTTVPVASSTFAFTPVPPVPVWSGERYNVPVPVSALICVGEPPAPGREAGLMERPSRFQYAIVVAACACVEKTATTATTAALARITFAIELRLIFIE